MKYRHIKLLMNIIVAPERWMRSGGRRYDLDTQHHIRLTTKSNARCPPAPCVKIGIVTLKDFRGFKYFNWSSGGSSGTVRDQCFGVETLIHKLHWVFAYLTL